MTDDASQADRASAGTLEQLEELAAAIADLSDACAALEGTMAAHLLAQMMKNLQTTLTVLANQQGMLVGTMPWRTKWRRGHPQSGSGL